MLYRITFAVDEDLGEIGDLRNTIVGGLRTCDPDSVTSLEGGGIIAIDIDGLRSVRDDSTLSGEGDNNR